MEDQPLRDNGWPGVAPGPVLRKRILVSPPAKRIARVLGTIPYSHGLHGRQVYTAIYPAQATSEIS